MNNNSTSIKGLIQGLIPDAQCIITGRVHSVSPLRIVSESDSKLILGEQALIVPEHLTVHTVTVSIVVGDEHIENAQLTVDNSLKANDRLYLLSMNGGRKYYVLDRLV